MRTRLITLGIASALLLFGIGTGRVARELPTATPIVDAIAGTWVLIEESNGNPILRLEVTFQLDSKFSASTCYIADPDKPVFRTSRGIWTLGNNRIALAAIEDANGDAGWPTKDGLFWKLESIDPLRLAVREAKVVGGKLTGDGPKVLWRLDAADLVTNAKRQQQAGANAK